MKKRTNRKPVSRSLTLLGISDILSIGLLIATTFGFLGQWHWTMDLFSHFRVQYMQLCLPLIGLYLWKRMNRRAIALVALAAINYASILPFYFGTPEPPTKPTVRAMLMNLNAGNGNTDLVMHAIREFDPDILLLEEVTPKWEAALFVLYTSYPYRIAKTRNDPFGIMLLCRHPIKNGEVVEIGTAAVPSISGTIYLPDGEIRFIGTHPLPPIGGEYSRQRNEQLMQLIPHAEKGPVLLMGDLNTSPWSPYFKRLLKESGLKNSMKGFGFQPTWPAHLPWPRIPLDHVLHSPEITVHHRAVGPDVGSDHLPVIVDFSMQ